MQDVLREYTHFSENSFLKTDKRKKRTGFHSKVKLGALSSLPNPAGQPPGVVRFRFLSYGHPASGSGPFRNFKRFRRLRCASGQFALEGVTVRAFFFGGIHFMGSHMDSVQGTVIHRTCVMHAVVNGTLDAVIFCLVHHFDTPSFLSCCHVFRRAAFIGFLMTDGIRYE